LTAKACVVGEQALDVGHINLEVQAPIEAIAAKSQTDLFGANAGILMTD
jgi:hypothetical protein